MTHDTVVLFQKAGETVPEGYLKAILETHQSCMGYAFAEEGRVKRLIDRDAPFLLSEVLEIQKAYKDKKGLLFCFSNYPAGFLDTDMQPFDTIKDDDGNVIAVTFMNGDFTPFAKEKSNHSNAFHCFNDLVHESVEGLFETTKDLNMVFSMLDKPIQRKQMLGNNTTAGSMVMMASNGQVLRFEFNNLVAIEGPWGWGTNHCGYSEPKPVAEAKPMAKSRLLVAPTTAPVAQAVASTSTPVASKLKPTDPVAAVIGTQPEKKGFAAIDSLAQGTVVEVKRSSGAVEEWVTLPTDQDRDSRRQWCNTHLGYVPQGYRKIKKVKMSDLVENSPLKTGKGPVIKDLAQIGEHRPHTPTVLDAKAGDPKPVVKEGEFKAEPAKSRLKTTVPSIPQIASVQAITPPAENLPVITAEEFNKVSAIIKGPRTQQAMQEILDPKFNVEKAWPTFANKYGLKGLEDTFNWDRKMYEDIVKNGPKSAAALLFEYKVALVMTLRSIPEVAKLEATPAKAPAKSRLRAM